MEVVREKGKTDTFIRSAALPWSWLVHNPALGSWNGGMLAAGRGLRSRLRAMGLSTNRYLLGGYHPKRETFENVFLRYGTLKPSGEDVFYCHPGIPDTTLAQRDSLVNERTHEYAFLKHRH